MSEPRSQLQERARLEKDLDNKLQAEGRDSEGTDVVTDGKGGQSLRHCTMTRAGRLQLGCGG